MRFPGELLAHDGKEFWKEDTVFMTVAQEDGLTLFQLNLLAVRAPCLGVARHGAALATSGTGNRPGQHDSSEAHSAS